MKKAILFSLFVLVSSVPALAGTHPAVHCIKTPTIECIQGYEPFRKDNGCYVCKPEQQEAEPSCVKSPTIECIPGYVEAENAHGCWSCVKDKQ